MVTSEEEPTRRSLKTSVPMSTAETGSTVSTTGRLADSAPDCSMLADSSRPVMRRPTSAHSCQCPSTY